LPNCQCPGNTIDSNYFLHGLTLTLGRARKKRSTEEKPKCTSEVGAVTVHEKEALRAEKAVKTTPETDGIFTNSVSPSFLLR